MFKQTAGRQEKKLRKRTQRINRKGSKMAAVSPMHNIHSVSASSKPPAETEAGKENVENRLDPISTGGICFISNTRGLKVRG